MDYKIALRDREFFFDFLIKKLGHRKKIPLIVKTLRTNPKIINAYLTELDRAIELFREFKNGASMVPIDRRELFHATYLVSHLGNRNLPTVSQIIETTKENISQIKKAIIPLLDQYRFLDTMVPTSKLLAAFTIFLYRSALLSLWPDLLERKVMVGSALEEMVAITAIRGKKTGLFEAVKPWIKDDKEEEFSPALVKAIRQL